MSDRKQHIGLFRLYVILDEVAKSIRKNKNRTIMIQILQVDNVILGRENIRGP